MLRWDLFGCTSMPKEDSQPGIPLQDTGSNLRRHYAWYSGWIDFGLPFLPQHL